MRRLWITLCGPLTRREVHHGCTRPTLVAARREAYPVLDATSSPGRLKAASRGHPAAPRTDFVAAFQLQLVDGQSARAVQGRPWHPAMGGKVELTEAGRFYLNADGVRMEMHLVAEGLRKLAMIARLIATGSLIDKGFLFWDEPEANLNPRIVTVIARTILHLCQSGIQVFIASHSLYLLRELDILLKSDEFPKISHRFFGLHKGNDGVAVQQGESVDDIGEIASLQEELGQSDRYMQAMVEACTSRRYE